MAKPGPSHMPSSILGTPTHPPLPFYTTINSSDEKIPEERIPTDKFGRKKIIYVKQGVKLGLGYSTPWSGYYASENGIFSPLVFKHNTWFRYNATWNQEKNYFENGYAAGYALQDTMLAFRVNPDHDPSTAPQLKKKILDPLR